MVTIGYPVISAPIEITFLYWSTFFICSSRFLSLFFPIIPIKFRAKHKAKIPKVSRQEGGEKFTPLCYKKPSVFKVGITGLFFQMQ